MERRQFLNWVGVGILAANLPVILAACSSEDNLSDNQDNNSNATADNTNISNTEEFVFVGTNEELQEQGFILNKEMNVIVIPSENGTPLAYSSKCTHQGCTIDWLKNDSEFFCYCHESAFAPNGTVISGPASKPLPSYPIKTEDNNILVKA